MLELGNVYIALRYEALTNFKDSLWQRRFATLDHNLQRLNMDSKELKLSGGMWQVGQLQVSSFTSKLAFICYLLPVTCYTEQRKIATP